MVAKAYPSGSSPANADARHRSPRVPGSPPIGFVLAVFLGVAAIGCNHRDNAHMVATSADMPKPAQTATHAASSATPAVAPLSAGARTEDERNSIDVFRTAAPSTVFVTQNQLVVDYFAGTRSEVPSGSGTGFIWDAEGHVVTNFHVIQGARSLSVTMQDHRTYEATVVGAEPRKDIAVLQLVKPEGQFTPIRVHPKKAQLEVGQKAIAIGNPFGLDQTLTTGVVSALGREVQGIGGVTIRDMVQTDAAINPGNSGGPLLDSGGYLIGMNTMIFSRSGASAGIGFAVPASTIQRVVSQIIQYGKARQVGLGVSIDPSQRLERRLGLKGVLVLSVIEGTPAAKLGLRGIQSSPRGLSLGDVIVGINDEKVDDYDDLYNSLDKFEPGAKVKVWVLRDKERVGFDFELIQIP